MCYARFIVGIIELLIGNVTSYVPNFRGNKQRCSHPIQIDGEIESGEFVHQGLHRRVTIGCQGQTDLKVIPRRTDQFTDNMMEMLTFRT